MKRLRPMYHVTASLMRLTMWVANTRWRYRYLLVRALLPIVTLSHTIMLRLS